MFLLYECLLTDVEADGFFSGSSDVENERVPTNVFVVIKLNMATNNNNNRGRSGQSNYTNEEMISFLSIMQDILPIGGEEWDEVLRIHSQNWPGRDVDSLRRKYGTLHRKAMPTGDPNVPPEARLAKRVKHRRPLTRSVWACQALVGLVTSQSYTRNL